MTEEKKDCDICVMLNRDIRALQSQLTEKDKQIEELTEQNTSLLTSVENLNKSVQELEAQIEELEKQKSTILEDCHNAERGCREKNKQNKELEKRCNELFFQVNEQVEQIEKAKELLGNWLQIAHKNHARCYGFVKDTEQFLEEN